MLPICHSAKAVMKFAASSPIQKLIAELYCFKTIFAILRRITIQVQDSAHRALKLLSILEGKTTGELSSEAIDLYLKSKGAYELGVARNES
jgi:hypothetical protein